ncbi:MAG: DUF6044 family protein [Oscillospiraceae bacterium]|nr:DUF6044 family protein [Oscillospiraceae bacterium]
MNPLHEKLKTQPLKAKHLENGFIALVMIVAVLPLIWYGKNSILPVHDLMEEALARLKMLKDNDLMFALDSPTNQLGNLSTAYFMQSFNIQWLIYLLFDVFTAFVICYGVKIIIGYFSMFLLLEHIAPGRQNAFIIKLVSISFALLPAQHNFQMSLDSIPLLCLAFLLIIKLNHKKIDKRVLWLLLFPFLSNTPMAGLFLLVFWVVGVAVMWIKDKKLNINLVLGLICLICGYIIVDLKLFYQAIVLSEPLNRTVYQVGKWTISEAFSISALARRFFLMDNEGMYPAPQLVWPIVFPVVLATLGSSVIYILYKHSKNELSDKHRYLSRYALAAISIFGMNITFIFLHTLSWTSVFVDMINKIVPFLSGFYFGRIIYSTRVTLYIVFALTLIVLLRIFAKRKARYLVYVIACLQIFTVLTSQWIFSHSGINLAHAKNIQEDANVTFREFFAEDFFSHIRSDMDYGGEPAAALGFHPSVLMYNGFSCVDGYLSTLPLSYMTAFREVIAPQLDRNPQHKERYDDKGIRMYLYNDEIFQISRKIEISYPVELYINTQAFKDLGGMYILSRAEISNADELGLGFVKYYGGGDEFIYNIWLYTVF